MSLSRRSFISLSVGALGAGVILTACGDSSDDAASTDGSSGDPDGSDGSASPAGGVMTSGFTLVQRYPNTSLTPGDVRLPVSIADDTGTLQRSGPDELTGRIVDSSGAEVATFVAARHGIGLDVTYWPITASLAGAGIYALEVEGATGMPTAFQLFDPADVALASPGEALPGFDTPTVDDARGVDPICTLAPDACPFHAVTLTDALSAGLPVVYVIGTPAHCATGTCGPGLEFLVAVAPEYAGRATFVHAEVYADSAATTVAPAVAASGTDYEPLVFITDADGMVRERIDIVWDEADMAAALARWID